MVCQTLVKRYDIRVRWEMKNDEVSKDLMARSEEPEINGLHYVRSPKGVRKIKYIWAFNRIHRSMAGDLAR